MPGLQENRDGLRHRRNVERMRQPGAVEIILSRLENLRLGLKPAKGSGEQNAGEILLENTPVILASFRIERVDETFAVKRAVKIVHHSVTLERPANLCEAVVGAVYDRS